jgi:hypothetical protein
MITFSDFLKMLHEEKNNKDFSLKNLTKTKIGNKIHYSYQHPSDKSFRWEGSAWDRRHAMSKVRDAYDNHRSRDIKEEGVPGNATGPAVAGTTGEPPVGKHKKKPVIVRRFAGKAVFEVNNDTYHKCINGKRKHDRYSKYVGDDETGQAIRSYGRTKKKNPIIVQNASTGVMTYLKHGK